MPFLWSNNIITLLVSLFFQDNKKKAVISML